MTTTPFTTDSSCTIGHPLFYTAHVRSTQLTTEVLTTPPLLSRAAQPNAPGLLCSAKHPLPVSAGPTQLNQPYTNQHTNQPTNQAVNRVRTCANDVSLVQCCSFFLFFWWGWTTLGNGLVALPMSMSTAILGVETTSMLPWLAVIVAVGVLVTAIVHRLGSDAKRRKGL